MLTNRAAPPNRAPIPIAAVCTGPWFSVAEVALDETEDDLLAAELVAAWTALETELLTEASSEDRELAAEPVAVERTELMEEARLAASEVMDDTRDETSLWIEETALESSEETDEPALAMLLAMLAAEDWAEVMELRALLSVVVDSWARAAEAKARSMVAGRILVVCCV